jgi:hypothetical protein
MLHPKTSRSNYIIIFVTNTTTYMVPPALPEVGEPVSESDLYQLKCDTLDPAQQNVSNDHHFKPPAHQVCYEVHIHCSVINVGKRIFRVFRCIKSAVFRIALLRKWLTKGRIEEFEDLACFT